MNLTLEQLQPLIEESIFDSVLLHKGENESFLLKTTSGWSLVLKSLRKNRLERITASQEIHLSQLLRSRGIQTSEFRRFTSGTYLEELEGHELTLQSLISGHMLSSPDQSDYRNIGHHLKELHDKTKDIQQELELPVLDFHSVVEENWKNVLSADFLPQDLLRRITYYKDLVRSDFDFTPASLVHFDAHTGNLLIQSEKIFFIDWEEAGYGNPILEIALLNCHFQRMEEGEKNLEAVLEGYGSDFDRTQLSLGTVAKFLDFMGNIPLKQDLQILKVPLGVFERYLGYFEKMKARGDFKS